MALGIFPTCSLRWEMRKPACVQYSGVAGSLDEAFRGATTNLVRWLEKAYNLNAAEVSSVLGTAMVYEVAEVVDPQVHAVAKVPKSVLSAFKRPS